MIGAYERTARKLLRKLPKTKPYIFFENGRVSIGTVSLHKTPAARVWRLFWRLKTNRYVG